MTIDTTSTADAANASGPLHRIQAGDFRRRSLHRVLRLAQHETIELRWHFGAVQLAILPGHAGILLSSTRPAAALGQLSDPVGLLGGSVTMTRSTAGSGD